VYCCLTSHHLLPHRLGRCKYVLQVFLFVTCVLLSDVSPSSTAQALLLPCSGLWPPTRPQRTQCHPSHRSRDHQPHHVSMASTYPNFHSRGPCLDECFRRFARVCRFLASPHVSQYFLPQYSFVDQFCVVFSRWRTAGLCRCLSHLPL
jgi:hypothetical protein